MVLVYKDVVTGDEMMSDAFQVQEVKDAEGNVVPGLMQVPTKMVPLDDTVDVGCGNAFGGEADEGPAADVEMVNNLMNAFGLTNAGDFSGADFKAWIKDYSMALLEKLKEQKEAGKIEQEVIKEWRTVEAPAIAKYLLKNIKDLEFYMGPAFNPESMVFSIYHDEEVTPHFLYIKKGFLTEKF